MTGSAVVAGAAYVVVLANENLTRIERDQSLVSEKFNCFHERKCCVSFSSKSSISQVFIMLETYLAYLNQLVDDKFQGVKTKV